MRREYRWITPTFEWVTRFGLLCDRADIPERNRILRVAKRTDIPYFNNHAVGDPPIRVIVNLAGQIYGKGKIAQGMLKNLDARRYQ